jgi:hypothetical protein
MGLLMDLRSGRRGLSGPGSVIFWLLAGASVGSAIVLIAPQITDGGRVFFGALGACIGTGLGFYAAFGASKLARILETPGVIVDHAIALFRG